MAQVSSKDVVFLHELITPPTQQIVNKRGFLSFTSLCSVQILSKSVHAWFHQYIIHNKELGWRTPRQRSFMYTALDNEKLGLRHIRLVLNGNLAGINELLKREGERAFNQQGLNHFTLAHHAAILADRCMVALLAKCGADMSLRSDDGWTTDDILEALDPPEEPIDVWNTAQGRAIPTPSNLFFKDTKVFFTHHVRFPSNYWINNLGDIMELEKPLSVRGPVVKFERPKLCIKTEIMDDRGQVANIGGATVLMENVRKGQHIVGYGGEHITNRGQLVDIREYLMGDKRYLRSGINYRTYGSMIADGLPNCYKEEIFNGKTTEVVFIAFMDMPAGTVLRYNYSPEHPVKGDGYHELCYKECRAFFRQPRIQAILKNANIDKLTAIEFLYLDYMLSTPTVYLSLIFEGILPFASFSKLRVLDIGDYMVPLCTLSYFLLNDCLEQLQPEMKAHLVVLLSQGRLNDCFNIMKKYSRFKNDDLTDLLKIIADGKINKHDDEKEGAASSGAAKKKKTMPLCWKKTQEFFEADAKRIFHRVLLGKRECYFICKGPGINMDGFLRFIDKDLQSITLVETGSAKTLAIKVKLEPAHKELFFIVNERDYARLISECGKLLA